MKRNEMKTDPAILLRHGRDKWMDVFLRDMCCNCSSPRGGCTSKGEVVTRQVITCFDEWVRE